MKGKTSVFLRLGFALVAAALSARADIVVTNVVATPRWPWDGKVDVAYEVLADDPATNLWVSFSGRDADRKLSVPVKTLTGDGADGRVRPGLRRAVWDVAADAPDASAAAFALTVTLKGAGWVLVNTNGPTGPGYGGIAAYDSERHVAVMFACVGSYPNDTWEYDGISWRQVTITGPQGRDSSGKMVYDSFNKKMIMQGGWWPDDNDPRTWEYRVTGPGPNDRQWVNIVQTDCAYRGANCLAYDSARHMILDFGGNHWQNFYNDTWRFDGSNNTWTWLQNWGPTRFWAGLVYDSARDRFVMFGGTGRWWSGDYEQGRGNTCEFNPTTGTWAEILPEGAPGVPAPRYGHSMVYDAAAGVTILKGGARTSDGYQYADTWEWNGTSWRQIPDPSGQPAYGVMWFDTALQKVVLFRAPNTYVYYR